MNKKDTLFWRVVSDTYYSAPCNRKIAVGGRGSGPKEIKISREDMTNRPTNSGDNTLFIEIVYCSYHTRHDTTFPTLFLA